MNCVIGLVLEQCQVSEGFKVYTFIFVSCRRHSVTYHRPRLHVADNLGLAVHAVTALFFAGPRVVGLKVLTRTTEVCGFETLADRVKKRIFTD